MLAVDIALTRLLAAYGIEPDMVMGHSLGEYGALVAAGALPFADALEAVSARGREMTSLSIDGQRARWPRCSRRSTEIERDRSPTIDGYVVIANVNSRPPGGDRRRQPTRSSAPWQRFSERRLSTPSRCR